jgi:hypothetical protein
MKMKTTRTLLFALSGFVLLGFATPGVVVAQESGSVTVVSNTLQTLNGVIRWKKTLGTVPLGPGKSEADPNPCSAFHILVVKADYEEKFVAFMNVLTWATRADGEFNICKYAMTVPTNKALRVYAMFGKVGDQSNEQWAFYAKRVWIGGGPEPEPGMARMFFGNPKTVTLGRKAMYLTFEMYIGYLQQRLPGAYPQGLPRMP